MALLLSACTQLFQPTGDGSIPDTKAMEAVLKKHVQVLGGDIGERHHYRQGAYDRAAAYIHQEFEDAGYEVVDQRCEVPAKSEYGAAAGKRRSILRSASPARARTRRGW